MNALIGTADASGLTDRALTHPAFTDFISSVRSEFDIIILDTPPLLPVIDSVHLAEKADVIVLIVKWASTSQKNVRIALKKLKDAKHPHTDVVAVLNQENAGNIANIKTGTSYYQN